MRASLLALAVACSSSTHTPQPARTGPPLPCELRDYTIRSVAEYVERDVRSKVGAARLRGAELFVEAQPGLTAEWLDLQFERHIQAARTPTADCPLDVDDAKVTVQSSGPGFLVRIRVDDENEAGEILRRARALARSTSSPAE